MQIEMDLNKIKKTAQKKDNENWKFRTFLKNCDYSSEKLDSMVNELYKEISSKIDCRKCANCCKEISPVLDEEDSNVFSKGLKMEMDSFRNKYLDLNKEIDGYKLKDKPCLFLTNNECSLYDFRPKCCQSYPHLNKEDFVFRLMNVIENYSVCPIVFNVYELLKQNIWHRPDFDVEEY